MPAQDLWELRYDPRVRKRLERVRNKTVLQRVEEAARVILVVLVAPREEVYKLLRQKRA